MPRSKSTSKKYSYFDQVSKSEFLKMMETKIQDLKQQKKQLLNSGDIDGAQKLEKKISELGMKDLPLVEYTPHRTNVCTDWFAKYKQLCHEFMSELSDCIEELALMNLPQDDFMNLIMGKKIPENFSIRLRVPLILGGDLSVENMFMCLTFPHSYNLDRFILLQNGQDILWLPDPKQKVYIPVSTLGGGPGGNGTEDRLTETAASQIVADRDI